MTNHDARRAIEQRQLIGQDVQPPVKLGAIGIREARIANVVAATGEFGSELELPVRGWPIVTDAVQDEVAVHVCLRTWEGWLYLAAVKDANGRGGSRQRPSSPNVLAAQQHVDPA